MHKISHQHNTQDSANKPHISQRLLHFLGLHKKLVSATLLAAGLLTGTFQESKAQDAKYTWWQNYDESKPTIISPIKTKREDKKGVSWDTWIGWWSFDESKPSVYTSKEENIPLIKKKENSFVKKENSFVKNEDMKMVDEKEPVAIKEVEIEGETLKEKTLVDVEETSPIETINLLKKEIFSLSHSLSLYAQESTQFKELQEQLKNTYEKRIAIIVTNNLRKDPKILAEQLDKNYLGEGVNYESVVSTLMSIKDVHLQKEIIKYILYNTEEDLIKVQELLGMVDREKLSPAEKDERTYTNGNIKYVYYPLNIIQYNPTWTKDIYVSRHTIDMNTDGSSTSLCYKPYILSSEKLERIRELGKTRAYMHSQDIFDAPENQIDADKLGESVVVVPKDVKDQYKVYLEDKALTDGKNYAILSKTNFKVYWFTTQNILVSCNDVITGKTVWDQQNDPSKDIYTTPGGTYLVWDKFMNKDFLKKYITHYISLLPKDDQYELKENEKGQLLRTLGFHGLYENDRENREKAIHAVTLPLKRISKWCPNIDPNEFDQLYDLLVSWSIVFITFEPRSSSVILTGKDK